ncbi:MAG TPA: hypothetical protein VE439_06370, partial [Anaerolineae bacterium]|nr:hypothetical protein [Anaerolineae bacterium]
QENRALRGESLISTRYHFYNISVEVRAHDSSLHKRLINMIDYVYARFVTEGEAEADLLIEFTDQRKHFSAFVCAGLNSSTFDSWPLASLVSSDPNKGGLYKVRGGLGFHELLRSIYHTILAFVLINLDDFLQVHAGAVAKGKTGIIFPGGSGSGKTTLVFGLTRAGYNFLSDEICFIDPSDLTVSPFPRSVFLRKDVVDLFGDLKVGRLRGDIFATYEKKCLIEIEENAVYPEDPPANIGFIIFPNYRPGERASIKEVPGVEALARLVSTESVLNMMHPGADQGKALDSISALVTNVPCLELTSSSIDDAATIIDGLID